ncbi:PREDICTED: 40S ribosomal protein SA-like [Amphimedon queenslandica]|uniref:Small ribosomal subunit protein uS2 n=1 Tax=Amphimedon queenslandica TaxID=400682 RepID=A0A1X7VTV5_AMPQE|nr:PREDICTED: 40S ribosomal protein SA-like [Amphimedon queenslandica]|eukprot:XP_003382764.1 PREDICTED: 40S ribosomal protein SA-like [Amphimedon queenslandica]
MSGGLDIFALTEDDVTKMLSAGVHLGDANINYQMSSYVYKVRSDGTAIINLRKTWEKLLLAARVIAAIENPADICVISNGNLGQRAILKFSKYVGCSPVAGRFTPGTFTNQIQKAFREPRLLVVADPLLDHQPITEASYVNIPVISFCNSSSTVRYVDVAIPCNTNGKHSQGLMWWMLAREVLRLKGELSRDMPWDIVPDLFFYRDPEDVEKEEQAKAEQELLLQQEGWNTGATDTVAEDQWNDPSSNWGEGTTAPSVPAPAASGQPTQPPGISSTAPFGEQDWNMGPTTTTKDWGADEGGEWSNTDTNVNW